MGNIFDARTSLEQAVKVAHENKQNHYKGQTMMFLGPLIIDQDASLVDAAGQTFREGLRMVEDLKLRSPQAGGHLSLGETYAIAGRKEKALASLKKARQMCQEMGMDYWLASTEKALEKLKAQ